MAKHFQTKNYEAVIAALGPEFWQTAPDDDALSRRLLTWLTSAAILLAQEINTTYDQGVDKLAALPKSEQELIIAEATDKWLAATLSHWDQYVQVARQFRKVLAQNPALDDSLRQERLRLVKLMNTLSIHA